jgi:hypothetical protein
LTYTKFSDRTGFSVAYSPSYTEGLSYSGWHTSSQSFNLTWRHQVGTRWTYSVSTSTVLTSSLEAVFAPTRLANIVSTPATFGDLTSAIIGGNPGNNLLGTILNSAQTVEAPAGLLLYGSSLLSTAVNGSLNYAQSSRLSLHMNVSADREQYLSDGSQAAGTGTGANPLVPHSLAGSVGVGVGYMVTPRTSVSMDVITSRAFSSIYDGYSSAVSVSVSRTMGMHWFTQFQGGTGFIIGVRQTNPLLTGRALPTGPQYVAGGSVGYKLRTQTLLATAGRSISDTYGLGSSATLSASGAWNWSRPGSSWTVSANFGEQRLVGPGFLPIDSWRVTAGLSRRVGTHAFVSTEYAYLSAVHLVGIVTPQHGQHMLRATLSWVPSGGAAR